MKKILVLIFLTLVLFICSSIPALALDNNSVIVTLPTFKITINGTEYNNSYSSYPLIVYKDITYFPMTYYDCRFLGLETEWLGADYGLLVNTTGVNGTYNPYKQNTKNKNSYKVSIASFPIKVNDKIIDNSLEEYPLLIFRDVTYFPMTWRFCVNEFNWQYKFDSQSGLAINSTNSTVKQLGALPYKSTKENRFSNVAINSNYIYYEATNGHIMRALLSDLSQTETVFQLPINDYYKDYCIAGLVEKNDEIYLIYRQGSYPDDYIEYFQLTDDGKAIRIDDYYYKSFKYQDISFKYKGFSNKENTNNLSIKLSDDAAWKNIGNDSYSYGLNREISIGNNDYGNYDINYFYYDGKQFVYTIAYNPANSNSKNSIYRIDITSNETVCIVSGDFDVSEFCYDDGYLYYHNEYVEFFRYNLATGEIEIITPYFYRGNNFVNNFGVLNETIYATHSFAANSLIVIDSASGVYTDINYPANLDSLGLKGDNNEYIVCTFRDTENSNYRMMVFDKSNKMVFKTSDKCYAKNIKIIGKKLYFYNYTTKTVCSYNL